ncbi:pentraxin fusion protein-like [Lissotriton helveticus]
MHSRMEIVLYLLLLARVKSETLYSCNPPASDFNIALQGFVRQSSVHKDSPGATAWLAVDGINAMDFHQFSCTQTAREKAPWWSLNLGKTFRISAVRIFNRNDCCHKRLMMAQIRVGNSPDGRNPICGMVSLSEIYNPAIFCCKGMEGQYVHILIPYFAQVLTLCEVQVYAVKATYA